MKLKAVIFDWAGTLVDYGSRAPVEAVQLTFAAAGVPVTVAEARAPMGLAKKAHIRAVLQGERVQEAWTRHYGDPPSETHVEALYAEFVPKQHEVLERHSQLIPGAAGAVARMRDRGLKIGTTTGYNRAMLDFLLARAAEQFLVPDSSLCPDDAGAGRPFPWMCYLTAIRLNTFPLSAFVKIGDTPADVEEGLNAGMWTIGVTRTGNEVGMTASEWEGLSDTERANLLSAAGKRLTNAGAHYTVESAAECDPRLDEIERRMEAGEKP